MNNYAAYELVMRHAPMIQAQGNGTSISLCRGCASPNGVYNISWPCDAVQIWDLLTEIPLEFDTDTQRDKIKYLN